MGGRRVTWLDCIVLAWAITGGGACFAQPGPGGGRGFRGGGGDPTFAADRDLFHELLAEHGKITREVTLLDNGVATVTESTDPAIAAKLQEHVAAMHDRLVEGRPIRMRDPLFAELFRHAEQVSLAYESTPAGVRVTETSDDPYVVQLIQAHAQVVSGFAERGFEEARLNHDVPAPDATAPTPPSTDASPLDKTALAALQRTYARLDRQFIPALALTDRGAAVPAQKAVARLRKTAAELASQAPAAVTARPEWAAALADVTARCDKAQQLIAAGDVKAAHEHLEPIRGLFVAQRRDWGVPYALDVLAAYHDAMEALVKPAAVALAAGDVYNADDLLRCRAQAITAAAAWARVEQTDFDRAYLSLTKDDLAGIDEALAAERDELAALNRALRNGDAQEVMTTAKALKPHFARIYMTFGEFPKAPQ